MISYQKVANQAKQFLYFFYSEHNNKPKFPILLEKIITSLSYKIIIKPLPQNVNAFTDMFNKLIYISEVINPAKKAQFLGRYKFTLAHEIAHIVLHEKKYLQIYNRCLKKKDFSDLRKLTENPVYEIEADIFAGNLILPRDLLRYEYKKRFGNTKIFLKNNTLYPFEAEKNMTELQKVTAVSRQALQIALKEIFILKIVN